MSNLTTPAYQVRTITDGGALVDLTAFTEEADARLSFDAWSPNLEDGEIIQLIEEDRIVAEYNPEYHG